MMLLGYRSRRRRQGLVIKRQRTTDALQNAAERAPGFIDSWRAPRAFCPAADLKRWVAVTEHSTGVEVLIGAKVQCLFCFET